MRFAGELLSLEILPQESYSFQCAVAHSNGNATASQPQKNGGGAMKKRGGNKTRQLFNQNIIRVAVVSRYTRICTLDESTVHKNIEIG